MEKIQNEYPRCGILLRMGWGDGIYLRFLKNSNLKCKNHTNSHNSKILKKSKKTKKIL